MSQLEALDWFDDIRSRFAGVGLEYRRYKPREWDDFWRAQLVASKNERANYRITVYGASMCEVIARLRAEVEKQESA